MKRTGLRCDSFGARQGKEQAVFIGIIGGGLMDIARY